MADWQDYGEAKAGSEHTVTGVLKLLEALESPQLGNQRDIVVYLPPSYDSGERHYPVLYLHDGQNLFNAETSFAGEWGLDESLELLSLEGIEAIAVGISNVGSARLDEYSPFHQKGLGGGHGDGYLDFIVNTLKPLIDADFRTCPEREHTAIMGSSMGGLISLYAFFRHSDVFGLAGLMSPSLWFAKGAIYTYVEEAEFKGGRLYIDTGTREHGGDSKFWIAMLIQSRRYYAGVRRMHRLLARMGYRPRRQLLYVEEKWARHEEAAWARRLPGALRFLLGE